MQHAVRMTLRSLARQPGLSLAVILTLALGIGASTALFAYLLAFLWPTLDAPDADRAVWVYTGTQKDPRNITSYLDFLDLQRHQNAVRDLVVIGGFGASVGHGRDVTFAWGQLVSGGFFSFFGARPEAGRLLQPADDRLGAEPVAVVSHRFWTGVLGGDPKAVGRPLRINGSTFTLVGVAPRGFQGQGRPTPLYVPVSQGERVTGTPRFQKRDFGWLSVLGRRAPGVSLAQTRAALDVAGHALDATAPWRDGKRRMAVLPATEPDPEYANDPYLAAARILMAAAVLFLLLGCANVANLLLARATARQREWGIRASLGASRWRLARSVLAESLLLCLAGGALGLPLAAVMARRIESYVLTNPGGLGAWSEGAEVVRIDLRAFAFALLTALLCATLCGLAPALRALRGDLVAPIKSDAAGATGGPAGALAPRKLLVVAQVALSALLLLGGGLLTRTLQQARKVDPGFNPRHLFLASLFVPRASVSTEGVLAVYDKTLETVRRLPGVQAANLCYNPPLAGIFRTVEVAPHERPKAPIEIGYNIVAPGYFETLGIPIVQGRALDLHDRRGSAPVVVVNRALARKLWGEENPVGRAVTLTEPPQFGDAGPTFEVVGVAGDVRIDSLIKPPSPMMYFAFEQRFHPRMTLTVRSSLPPAVLAPALREAVSAAHPDVSVVDLLPLDEQIQRSLIEPRMYAEIAGIFGLLGLLVAVLGLFSLLSYTVSQRTREIGIRMAVGAGEREVLRLVLGQGMALVAAGLALGIASSLALTRLMSSLLFGVGATDPFTFISVPVVLLMVTLLASWLPAQKAARLDPVRALK
ncbi:MAG TPA: ABC transporter permease [Thermoanaerobaculia bacterium]|nr:ABC transporter permease [Thermoanaerobaculia bacterium]